MTSNKLILGDCLEKMKQLPENSVDCLVTDPPYFLINNSGKGFMGKEWESLSESKIMGILCKSKSIVKSVERFLILHQVEQNIIVEDFAQNNAKTNGCQELKTQKTTSHVQCVENNSKEANRKEKASMSSVHGFVLTKAEALDLLKELCPNHITAIENLKENVLFAIPYSFIVSLLKGTVLENVLKFPIETVCSEKTILLSLMEEARINAVTEAMIGKLSDYKCMNVTNTPVEQKDAEYIVKEKRYRHITSNPINNQKIIHWLTLLLSATNVTLKSKKDLYQYTIYQFHLNWLQEALRVLKNGSFAFIITTPRQDSLSSLISAVKDAGFEVGFTPIVWTYASGFPKATNVAKMVDKRLGEKGTVINPKTYPDIRCNNYSNSQGKTRLCGGNYLPSANEAKVLDGCFCGFQPKPALEVLLRCQKPFDTTSLLTVTTSYSLRLIATLCGYANIAENSLNQHEIVRDYIAQKLVTANIAEEAKASIGKVASWLELTDMLKSILAELETKQNMNWNTELLWKIILADLLGKTSRFTTETATELITDLKTLNSYLTQIIQRITTNQEGFLQNGLKLNVGIVDSIILNVLTKLKSLNQTIVVTDVTSPLCPRDQTMSAFTVGKYSKQIIQSENTALKNATTTIETKVILVAMKPLSEKTFVDQALTNGKGVTWLDNVRIPFQSTDDKEQAHDNALGPVERFKTTKPIYEGGKQSGGFVDTFSEKGRFPANLLVSDDVLNDGTITKSSGGHCGHTGAYSGGFKEEFYEGRQSAGLGDSGGFSRYFDLDAWFSKTVSGLPKKVQKTFPFLVVPKASKSERNKGCESLPEDKVRAVMFTTANNTSGVVSKGFERFETLPKRNFHPTVKPLKLMSYLVTLGSRPNDLVLDPFCGSGTTCLASVLLNRCFIGIDNCLDYLTIADARLKGVLGDDLVCVNKHGELNYSFKQKKL